MFRKLNFLILLLLSGWLHAQDVNTFIEKADVFFKNYVSNGRVDYISVKKNPTALNDLMKLAGAMKVENLTDNQIKAFWINAYNLTVIKGITDNYPLKSPLDKSGFFDKTTYFLAGSKITLNDIENNMLRARFKDARIHFVLVCGALGCPPIISNAYAPETLDNQLETQTISALNDPQFIRVSGKKVLVSEIFKWYKDDFLMASKKELDFINTYRKVKIPENSNLSYYTYNWNLNIK